MHQTNTTDHARHDLALIAGHAAGDLLDRDQAPAQALLAGCSDCRDLHADLVAIAAATRVLPAPAARLRDFQLAPEQAAGLRRGSWLRAILRPFAATRSTVRPMAAAFSSLGIAGLLVATLLPGMLGATALAPTERDVLLGAPGASAAPPDAHAPGPGAAAASPDTEFQVGGLKSTSHPDDQSGEGTASAQGNNNPPVAVGGGADNGSGDGPAAQEGGEIQRAADASSPSLLLIASLAFLAVGLGLFGLRLAARRVR